VPELVVISAHLDDAVLSCYGALSPTTTVVTVFAGFPPPATLGSWDAGGGATDSRERIAERREEDRAALRRSGARLVHLDFPDVQYVTMGAVPATPTHELEATLRGLIQDDQTVLAPCALSAMRRPHWLRRRRYSDHRFVRDAVLAVRPNATLYADLPYALNPRTGGFALPRDIDRRGYVEHRRQLDAELVAAKVESVRCYSTQLDQLVATFGDFVNPESMGLEVYWESTRD
jgi:LmbE family N-acetylglucosaminyl deacetylase